MTMRSSRSDVDVGSLREDLDKAIGLLESVERRQGDKNTIAQVNVNAGGLGVAVCVLCLVAVTAGGSVYAFMANRESQRDFIRQLAKDTEQDAKIAGLGDYLQAIYAQAPQLKPQPKDDAK